MSGAMRSHVGPAAEGHVRELLEADLEDLLAHRDEALVAGDVAGREAATSARIAARRPCSRSSCPSWKRMR
jgi:hypothetical protein